MMISMTVAVVLLAGWALVATVIATTASRDVNEMLASEARHEADKSFALLVLDRYRSQHIAVGPGRSRGGEYSTPEQVDRYRQELYEIDLARLKCGARPRCEEAPRLATNGQAA